MKIDKATFFREVTMALCCSLDIQDSLNRCLHYLRNYLPVDSMILGLFIPEPSTIKHIANAGLVNSKDLPKNIPLPPDIGKLIDSAIMDTDRLVLDTQQDPLTSAVASFVENHGCSEIILPLKIRDAELGYLVMQVKGVNRYTKQHLDLMSSVRDPFAIAMANALKHQEVIELKEMLAEDNRQLKEELTRTTISNSTIIGRDAGLKNVMEMVCQVAPLTNTILLLGETGVGKEVIANAIHAASPRYGSPLVKVNCGAIPETLIDSELFGHEKGAFSGASSQKIGRFERAHGGTIFLDEIGELPPQAQVRLLRVLQNKEIERVGGSGPIPVDIRVIAATHRNLESMVTENQFREDLWFRLNVFPIIIPPLRQRREDIPILLEHLVKQKSEALGFRSPPPVAAGALDTLMVYDWPGNIRELENVVERALIQSKGRSLFLDHFAMTRMRNGPVENLGDQCGCVFPCLAANQNKTMSSEGDASPTLQLDDVVYRHIQEVLSKTGGKVHGPGGAAEKLGMNPSTLRNKMNKLGIEYGKRAG